ncbi:hypothetical protein DEU56DRAFT_336703 [Suillus clintonianus]|uniref:uncharacterized protein n=1 Tax=Suillus clintonianus TaxID=1904413 RepID=UPI001B872EC8|nr:uncharacterized protein DEU56DRAFT_336703 [Suillus clintonianus]KAG2138511.1 hypothetical protein DEU56DRAFT_336703 [Suillus clintonianus]
MYSKLITIALVFAATFAPTGAVTIPRDNDKHIVARWEVPPANPNQVSCNGYQPWQHDLAYKGGSSVIHNSQLWTAKYWNYNNGPGTPADQWYQQGCCLEPIYNKAYCEYTSPWSKTTGYSKGSQVTDDKHLWMSVQWTQSNKPGDTSGTWRDLGVCQ